MSIDPERCISTHNPGVWPFTSRCVRPVGHDAGGSDWAACWLYDADPSTARLALPEEHYDQHGQIWADPDCQFNPLATCPSDCERSVSLCKRRES